MGKSKSSRKGKKAWRRNISTHDIDELFEKTTNDALSGGPVIDDSFFFLDKSTDLSIKRKIDKHREKVLHCDSVLQRNAFVLAVPSSKQKKPKKKLSCPGETSKAKRENFASLERDKSLTSTLLDLWGDKGEEDTKNKKKRAYMTPAVEVEPPGCSFNPSFEAHQDALALAVAEERQKIYRKELGPQPVPQTVPGDTVDEEDLYFLNAHYGNEEEDEQDEYHSDDDLHGQRPAKMRRLTRVELNRRARHKEQLNAELEAKKLEKISKEIDCLPDIIKEIAKEDEEKHRKHVRRVIARQERLKSGPPRLGRHKFEPAPLQVLLSEEISGSLRKLKGCCTLTRDRFKSIEKVGLIAPTAKRHRN